MNTSNNESINNSVSQEPTVTPSGKVYTGGNLFGAAIIGGIFATVYMMYINYKEIGMNIKATNTLRYGFPAAFIFYLSFFAFMLLFMGDSDVSFGIIIASAMYGIALYFQYELLENHTNSGGGTKSIWKALLVALIALVATLAVFFPVTMLMILAV